MERSLPKLYRAGSKVFERYPVPEDRKPWHIQWPDYRPTPVNIDFGPNKPWADPDLSNFHPKWNEIDGKVDRRSHHGPYGIDRHSGYPLNPDGRTGVCLRGLLGRWGPNHAADPIVTRWKRLSDGGPPFLHPTSGKPVLQFVAIQRSDVGQWAIPGGMVDPGETVSETLKREFFEESLNALEMSHQERESTNDKLRLFFSKGHPIYKGIVHDPRNTDNAWIETVAVNFHDDGGHLLQGIRLTAGDDARRVQWMDIDRTIKLYASHWNFIATVVKNHAAHW